MMRLLDIALLLPMTVAFALSGWEVSQKTAATAIHLQAECSRRYALFTTASAVIAPFEATTHPAKVGAYFCDDTIEFVEEPQQMAADGKVDLNAALVGDYKRFPGMFPHAAGMIASNGPYGSVKDIYNIEGLTENDKRLFKKYGKEFTTNLPARRCMERINN